MVVLYSLVSARLPGEQASKLAGTATSHPASPVLLSQRLGRSGTCSGQIVEAADTFMPGTVQVRSLLARPGCARAPLCLGVLIKGIPKEDGINYYCDLTFCHQSNSPENILQSSTPEIEAPAYTLSSKCSMCFLRYAVICSLYAAIMPLSVRKTPCMPRIRI